MGLDKRSHILLKIHEDFLLKIFSVSLRRARRGIFKSMCSLALKKQVKNELVSHLLEIVESKFGYMLETPSIFKYELSKAVKILKCGQSAGKAYMCIE